MKFFYPHYYTTHFDHNSWLESSPLAKTRSIQCILTHLPSLAIACIGIFLKALNIPQYINVEEVIKPVVMFIIQINVISGINFGDMTFFDLLANFPKVGLF